MKTELIVVGKTSNQYVASLVDDYVARIEHYIPFHTTVVQEVEKILQKIDKNDSLILLDERGEEKTSVELATWLSKKQQSPHRLVFAIGGPYGFSKAVYDRANEMLSLSRMTFSHQLVRLVFTEQLYRACTILKGEPYHH